MKTNGLLNEISQKLISVIVDVEIEGIAPLLQNNIDGSAEQMARKGKRSTGGVKDDPEEWKGKLYKVEGGLGHPGGAIDSALIKAALEMVALDQVKEILDHAGRRVGIGDWRPKFGRFFVSKFEKRR